MDGENELLLSFVGDDFTGSTDAMESLTAAGLRTVLFLDVPTPKQLTRFDNLRAVGIATMSRSMSPVQMSEALPPLLVGCRALGAPLVQYKVCSTFDSSPEIGSIGQAMELGSRVFGTRFIPLVVGAPNLGRYCAFGTLFARSGLDTEPHRLDRHPTMRHHPITPMLESDLRVHLGLQTQRQIGLLDLLTLDRAFEDAKAKLDRVLAEGADVVLFDVLGERHLPVIGRLIWDSADHQKPLYAVGSSGLNSALAAHWRNAGLLGGPKRFAGVDATDQILVVSGSCSPVADRQIGRALAWGFADVALATERHVDPQQAPAAVDAAVTTAIRLLASGRSVIIHTSRGPNDPRIEATFQEFGRMGFDRLRMRLESGQVLGASLGRVLCRVLEAMVVGRVVVVGGDTSGAVARELGVEALEMVAPTAPGAPLCRVHAPGRPWDSLEIVFKGGQMGRDDYFPAVLGGYV